MIDEGTIKFVSEWTPSAPLELDEIRTLIEWRRPLFAAGLVGHDAEHDVGYGNLSVRCADGPGFVITGTQTGHIAEPGAEHFARVTGCDIEANVVRSIGATEASSESLTHAAIYALSPRIAAVVHVHDPELWTRLLDTVPTTARNVPYGTPAMAREFARLHAETGFADGSVAVMAGHEGGLVAAGATLWEAARRILDLLPTGRR